jgi:MFS transporter, AAHS family, 4-hydroxybenzoate transporter
MQGSRVLLADALQTPAAQRFARKILVLCGLLTAIEGIDIYIVASALPVLARIYGAGPGQFAIVLSVQAVGQLLGSYLVAPLADRLGRRPLIIACVGGFGILTIACAFTRSLAVLAILRFLALILIGGAQPNLFAAAAEFAVPSRRHRYLLAIGAIHSLGAGIAAILTAWLLAVSWNAPFLLFGTLSVLATLAAVVLLPETIAFLAARGESRAPQLRDVLDKIGVSAGVMLEESVGRHDAPRVAIGALFAGGRASVTLLLWLCAACSIPLLSTIGQWLPTFLHNYGKVGLTTAAAMTSMSAVPAALWPIALSRIMDRIGVARGLALNLLVGALCMTSFAWVSALPALGWFIGVTFGVFVAGSVTGVYALAAQAYPVDMRATGMGWAIGAGRVVATVIPLMGGAALAQGASAGSVATCVSALLSLAALAAFLLSFRLAALPAQ